MGKLGSGPSWDPIGTILKRFWKGWVRNIELWRRNSNLTHFEIVFFHIFPGIPHYLNSKENSEKYGTKLYFPEWWKKSETLELGALCVKPSFDLTLRESYELFIENQITLSKVLYNREKKSKGAFDNFLQRTMKLKNQENNMLNFLNENKIEM